MEIGQFRAKPRHKYTFFVFGTIGKSEWHRLAYFLPPLVHRQQKNLSVITNMGLLVAIFGSKSVPFSAQNTQNFHLRVFFFADGEKEGAKNMLIYAIQSVQWYQTQKTCIYV